MALAAAGGLADHRRPQLRRPRAVAARPGRHRATGPAARCGRPPVRRRSSTTSSARSSRPGKRPLLDAAMREGRIAREGDPEWRDDVPVRVEAIPVRRGDRLIAVVARNTNLQGVRTPSRLELSYLQTASELSQMIARGSFPFPGSASDHADTPRVATGSSASTRRARHLRQPQRALGLPQARADRRPQRQVARRGDPRAGPGRDATGRGDHQRRARRPDAARHRARQRPGAR